MPIAIVDPVGIYPVTGNAIMPAEIVADEQDSFVLAAQGKLELIDLMACAERLKSSGKAKEAIDLYTLWLEHSVSPLAYVGYFNLGVELASGQEYTKAEVMYRKTLELNPDFIRARLNLGNSLEQQKREDEALEEWRIALKSENILLPENLPLHLHALNNLGRLLETKKNYKESLAMLEESFSLDPTQRDVLLHLVHLIQKICRWPVFVPPKGITKEEMISGTSPLAMLAASDDPALQLSAAKQFIVHKYPVLSSEALVPKQGYSHEKIRIGYLSSDFCLHAVSLLTVELMELHNHERFEVYGFCWSREDGTAIQQRIIKAMDNYIQIGAMSDKEAADCIRAHEIDIVIDLQGLTSGARPLILSYRPATLQMTYLGFPGTTGFPWIDYVIADSYLIPAELVPYHSEKPLYLPNCFQSSDSKREVGLMPSRADNGLPEKAFVFCSFNNNYKFTPELFAVWMRILKRVPNSVFWLLADNEWSRENLTKAAKKQGIKEDRLIFAPRVAPADYLARYQLADLFLDTFPFNGGTTANDALFMGLPLLTLSGRTFASRMAGSLLTNLGLPELIARNLKEYEEKAVRLAKNAAELNKLKNRLKENKATGPVFDMPRFVKDYEVRLANELGKCRSANQTFENLQVPAVVSGESKLIRGNPPEIITIGSRMKAVILAGGLGTRISEESHLRPKPMIEIGGRPILWHIMKIYSSYGINDFVICLGYKGYIVKEYFANYFLHMSNVTFDMANNSMEVHQQHAEPWRVTLVDTGENTMTGGRLKRIQEYVGNETFCCTYGDGVADIPIDQLIAQHRLHGKLATVTAIQPPGRYGALAIEDAHVRSFQEKPAGDGAWVNGGFFVLEPGIFDYIDGDDTSFEGEPLQRLVENGEMASYCHSGFWLAMDTLRDKNQLEDLWKTDPPWKVW